MPTDQGLWLHDHQGLAPVEPTSKPDQGDTCVWGHLPRRDAPFTLERELFQMAEPVRECRHRCEASLLLSQVGRLSSSADSQPVIWPEDGFFADHKGFSGWPR